jgi:hypothetical protein
MFHVHVGQAHYWFRVFGYGVHVKDLRRDAYVPFSERNGLRKVWYVGPFKVGLLRRKEVPR